MEKIKFTMSIAAAIAFAIAFAIASHAAAQTANLDKIGIDAGKIQLSGITDNSVRAEIAVGKSGDYLLYAWIFGIRKSEALTTIMRSLWMAIRLEQSLHSEVTGK